MKLTIDHFEDEVHALMLARGKEHFEKGQVIKLEQTVEGWSAEVDSTQVYRIVLFGNAEFQDWHCDCPFDHGPVCKHVAGTLYAIRGKLSYEKEEAELATNIMKDLESAQIKGFLKSQFYESESLRKSFLGAFFRSSEEE